jgi:hypothetical protein
MAMTIKKGTYKIIGYYNPNDKTELVVKTVDGFLFDYKGHKFGCTRQCFNQCGELLMSDTYLISDIDSGVSTTLKIKNVNREDIETQFENNPKVFEIVNSNTEKLKTAKDMIRKSYLGKLLR